MAKWICFGEDQSGSLYIKDHIFLDVAAVTGCHRVDACGPQPTRNLQEPKMDLALSIR